MEDKKSLFDTINEVCDENNCLHEENNWLKNRCKCLEEEIDNREKTRIDCDAYVKVLINERNELRKEINDKEEIIESWVDEYNARCEYSRRLNKENMRLHEEIKAMAKDHEVECEDYCIMISERVNIDDLHIILAKYLTDKYTPEPAKICFFEFLDEIKKFIDSNKKEC